MGESVELIDVKEGEKFEVYLRYLGACSTCASGMMTLMAIEDELNRNLNTDKIKVIQI